MTKQRQTAPTELDAPLHRIGFEFDVVTADVVTGRFTVTERCCQPYKILHGGVSALVAEALASIGTQLACKADKRAVGIQLSINHHRSARLGDRVLAEAAPLQAGNTIQVWEVRLWKLDDSPSKQGSLQLASSRVTLLTNMAVSEEGIDTAKTYKKYETKKHSPRALRSRKCTRSCKRGREVNKSF